MSFLWDQGALMLLHILTLLTFVTLLPARSRLSHAFALPEDVTSMMTLHIHAGPRLMAELLAALLSALLALVLPFSPSPSVHGAPQALPHKQSG